MHCWQTYMPRRCTVLFRFLPFFFLSKPFLQLFMLIFSQILQKINFCNGVGVTKAWIVRKYDGVYTLAAASRSSRHCTPSVLAKFKAVEAMGN